MSKVSAEHLFSLISAARARIELAAAYVFIILTHQSCIYSHLLNLQMVGLLKLCATQIMLLDPHQS